jgi:hypothetical protein
MMSFCRFDFHPLFLFADAVFPWFVYAGNTSETAALNTHDNEAVLSQMVQLNLHQ